jgi:hypothetical protein
MSFQPEPDSATALRERALRFRRGAVRGFQRSLPADPLRQASRQHETAGPRVVERKRQRLTLGQIRVAMSETVRRISRRVLGRAPRAGVGHP